MGGPVDFAKLAGSDDAVVMTALIEFVWAATGMGIAIALYPVLRLFNPLWLLALSPAGWSRTCSSWSGPSACLRC